MTTLLDQADRDRAVRERERNVVVDASAGTGKTKLVVDRLVELLAPTDGRDPIPIERIAAITFTRKAAGELRVRTRQRILETLAALPNSSPRSAPLLRALGGIDIVHIGTIHSFADRLLRKWPGQARLDPMYELEEDTFKLAGECFQLLVSAAETRTLHQLIDGSPITDRADEASFTILDAQQAGLRLRSHGTEHWTYHGLDGLIAGFVLQRDVDVADPPPPVFDTATFRRFADEYLALVDKLSSETQGGKWLVETGMIVRRMVEEPDPVIIYRELVDRVERGPRGRASDGPRRNVDFLGDDRAWDVWKALEGDDRQEPVRSGSLRDDLLAPLRGWIARRLVRLRPVVLHVYELVKARHQAVDQIDLLLRLRNLLRDDHAIRRACQGLFDHIFVDEFQDTDPLQAEIVLFLCERGTPARTWDAVTLAPGTLTVVGDPKQSIYRFRRADIATYQRVVDIIARSPNLMVRLTSSFRSAPCLVDWFNARFGDILGIAEHGERFRRENGDVYYQGLTKGRTSGGVQTVHAVAFDSPDGGDVVAYRALEAETMARYLRWLVNVSGLTVVDPITSELRAVRYGDVGVLGITTTNLPILFDAFDRNGIAYAARGGTLFLADPLHRRFLLGLSALADRDDGVALAALLRPPFFAVDLADLARMRADDPDDRAVQARAAIQELRRRRFERTPGATARALLEETAFARAIALGPNGAQRLSGLRELCFQIEKLSLAENLDFDAAIERARTWIDEPRGLDRPHPIGDDTVRVMTIHQAKGLEFPVVMLWDARAMWTERTSYEPWTVERDGRGWALRLDMLKWEEPAGLEIAARERKMREAERKRLIYVAATRARDVLIVPKVGNADDRFTYTRLLGSSRSATVVEHATHLREMHAAWFDAATPSATPLPRDITTEDLALKALWNTRAREAAREALRPVAFTDASSPRALWGKKGRFGTVFGETVHLAIGMALRSRMTADESVARAACRTGLTLNIMEATEDVTRTLVALARLGVVADSSFELEYPVAGVSPTGQLVAGYVDLVANTNETVLLDFKTDVPPSAGESIAERYIEQVRGYASVLAQALNTQVRAGLLFTADGAVRWLSSGDNGAS